MNQAEVTKFPAPSEADTATVEAAAGGNGCDAERSWASRSRCIAGLRQPRGLHLPRDRARGREQQLGPTLHHTQGLRLAQPFPWSAHARRHRIPGRDPHLRVPVLHGAHRLPRRLAPVVAAYATSSSWARSSSSPSRSLRARRRAGPAQVLPRGIAPTPPAGRFLETARRDAGQARNSLRRKRRHRRLGLRPRRAIASGDEATAPRTRSRPGKRTLSPAGSGTPDR